MYQRESGGKERETVCGYLLVCVHVHAQVCVYELV